MSTDLSILRQITGGMERESHPLLKLANPRRIAAPSEFFDMNLFPALVYGVSMIVKENINLNSERKDNTNFCAYAVFSQLIKNEVPKFFIKEELLEALTKTDPPSDMLLNELIWARESMVFMLPRDFGVKYIGSCIKFVALALIEPQSTFECKYPLLNGVLRSITVDCKKQQVMMVSCVEEEDNLAYYHLNISTEKKLSDVCFGEIDYYGDVLGKEFAGKFDKEKDTLIANKLSSLGLKLLIAINARPELVTMGGILKAREVRSNSIKKELWSPNYIGRSFYHSEKSESNIHLRLHFKRGHFRCQHFGNGGMKTKVIWIEPYLAGTEE